MAFARRPRLLCLLCQWRTFSTSYRQLAKETSKGTTEKTATTTPPPPKYIPASPLEHAPRSYGKQLEEFTPTPLSRPIGLLYPPEPGQNTGVDHRTLRQRRDDFVNYERHLKRRQEMTSKFARPYFRDWVNMKFHKGKTFIAPPRPFKGDLSLFFPNLYGRTLEKSAGEPRDTTPTLQDRISVVSVFSSTWAENQTRTFASPESNPALERLLEQHRDRAQHVWINVEEDALKAWLIRLFMGSIRARIGEPNWGRYFVVRRGISDEIREGIGLLNSKVGYVYLLDGHCRIRWAGSGPSEDHEREGLVKAVHRLLEEEKASKK